MQTIQFIIFLLNLPLIYIHFIQLILTIQKRTYISHLTRAVNYRTYVYITSGS